jgi:proteasome lid subunit RPN8/RPN11
VKLDLPKALRRRLLSTVQGGGRLEIGGVLMAEQLAPGDFRLVDFSTDSRTGSQAHFIRTVEDHQAALTKFFEDTGSNFARFNYLGEWHSHPNHPPVPSVEDVASMHSLVHGERDIPFAVLIIAQAGRWNLRLSATLFERGARPRTINILTGDNAPEPLSGHQRY